MTAARQLESKKAIAKRLPGVQKLFGQDVSTAEEESRFPFRLRLLFSKDVLGTILPFWQSDYLDAGGSHAQYEEAIRALFPGIAPGGGSVEEQQEKERPAAPQVGSLGWALAQG